MVANLPQQSYVVLYAAYFAASLRTRQRMKSASEISALSTFSLWNVDQSVIVPAANKEAA